MDGSIKFLIKVVSKPEFPETVEKFGTGQDIAYISIEATPDCAKYYLEVEKEDFDNDHFLPPGPNVLNLEFDDTTKDFLWHGHQIKTISGKQAKVIVDFIEGHLGKTIIVHCKAGMSRSQGVARFVLDTWPDLYEQDQSNPCLRPNPEVVRKLKRYYIEKHGIYSE